MTKKYDESSIRMLLSSEGVKARMARSKKRYYVYVIWGATLGPIYVGKGQGHRALDHEKEALRYLKANPHMPYDDWITTGALRTKPKLVKLAAHLSYAPLRYQILCHTDNELKALRKEAKLIKLYGIAKDDHGILSNIGAGGPGGSGNRGNVDVGLKISEANRGRKLNLETRMRMSASGKGRFVPDALRAKLSAIAKTKDMVRRANPCVVHGVRYRSISQASRALGIKRDTLAYRIKVKHEGHSLV